MSSTWNFKKQFFVLFWHHFWELEETDVNAALPLRSSEWAGRDSPVTASHHGDRDMHSSRHAAHALGTWRNHWGLKGHWETFTQRTVLQGKQRPLNLWKPRILNELSVFSSLGPNFHGKSIFSWCHSFTSYKKYASGAYSCWELGPCSEFPGWKGRVGIISYSH